MKHELGQHFVLAFCNHFGLPTDQVECPLIIEPRYGEMFKATVSIAMTADDLAAIAKLMQARHAPERIVADKLERAVDDMVRA